MFNTIKIVKTIDCWILRHFALSTFVSLMRLDWLLSLSPINISSSNGMDIFLCHCHCHCRFHCHCQKFIMAIFLLRAFHFSSEIVNSQPYNKIKRNLLFPNFYAIPDHRCVFNGFCLLPTSLLLLFFRSLLWSFDVLVYHWFYWTSGHFPTALRINVYESAFVDGICANILENSLFASQSSFLLFYLSAMDIHWFYMGKISLNKFIKPKISAGLFLFSFILINLPFKCRSHWTICVCDIYWFVYWPSLRVLAQRFFSPFSSSSVRAAKQLDISRKSFGFAKISWAPSKCDRKRNIRNVLSTKIANHIQSIFKWLNLYAAAGFFHQHEEKKTCIGCSTNDECWKIKPNHSANQQTNEKKKQKSNIKCKAEQQQQS